MNKLVHTMFAYDKTFDPKVVLGQYDLIYGSVIFLYISALNWYMDILLSGYV